MFSLEESGEYREEIKKSKFICFVKPVFSESEATDFIKENSDLAARHNCWAWKIGNDYRFNDDGEPSGTAGKPILNAIDYADLTNVAALVVRWFGGIKLGTGGLCRAYGGVTSSCLKNLQKSEIKSMVEVLLTIPFEFTNSVYCYVDRVGLNKISESYVALGLSLQLNLEKDLLEKVKSDLQEMSRGQISIKKV